ncbi:hypothetical protein [Bradyrhizobium campsiandrae]|nr:hypothetical protein [Bradyrhizobium campsiandrae]
MRNNDPIQPARNSAQRLITSDRELLRADVAQAQQFKVALRG